MGPPLPWMKKWEILNKLMLVYLPHRTGTRAVSIVNSPNSLKFSYLASLYPQNTFGECIRKWRLEQELRQVELAEMLGVNQTTIRLWEGDKHKPTLWRKEKLENMMGESLETK